MAAILGPNTLAQLAIPTNWDATMLRRLALADGATYESLITDIAAGLALKNGTLLTNPAIASLISLTPDASLEYRVGNDGGFEPHTELTQPGSERAASTGSMLPLASWDKKLEWTWDMLRKARRRQVDDDIAIAMDALQNLWEKAVLTRLFKSTYNAFGTGKVMPIADGGTADSTYIPPQNPSRSGAFLYTHTHLLRLDGITQANLETAIAHLWEHGYDAPYDLVIAQADVASWSNTTNVTGWTLRGDPLVTQGALTDIANVGDDYISVIKTSVYGTVRVRASARIPPNYWAVYKSFGSLDPRNPLLVRQSPDYGIGGVLLPGRQHAITQFPLEGAIIFTEFGVGVADRVGAAIVKNAASSVYTDPTIV